MAQDPRHLDTIEKVVSAHTRAINDRASTILSRLSAHTHQYPKALSSVSGTGDYVGQLVYNTTDNMLYRYEGSSVWTAVLALGGSTAATHHEIRYEATNGQSIANATDTKLQFPTAVTTSNDVTASGTNNTDFLLNRAGWWLCTASIRYLAATTGERHLGLATGTTVGTLSARFAVQSTFPGTSPGSIAIATVKYFGSSTSIFAATWQNNGSAVALETAFGSTNHISLTWLRPAS